MERRHGSDSRAFDSTWNMRPSVSVSRSRVRARRLSRQVEAASSPDWTLADARRTADRDPDELDDDRERPRPGPKSQEAMATWSAATTTPSTRYIHLKVRDRHLADEVLQEFWTKLLTGKLAGADKTKGRFRDYLRTVLHRLIIDHFREPEAPAAPSGRPARRLRSPTRNSTASGARRCSGGSGRGSKPIRRRLPRTATPACCSSVAIIPKASIDEITEQLGEIDGERRDPRGVPEEPPARPGPSSSSCSSSGVERDHPSRPTTPTSRPKSTTSGWATCTAATAVRASINPNRPQGTTLRRIPLRGSAGESGRVDLFPS